MKNVTGTPSARSALARARPSFGFFWPKIITDPGSFGTLLVVNISRSMASGMTSIGPLTRSLTASSTSGASAIRYANRARFRLRIGCVACRTCRTSEMISMSPRSAGNVRQSVPPTMRTS
jgi:hypothetical protein